MTYPVDDLGNPRVDFVWGQFPIQPDDQRVGRNIEDAISTDGIWTNFATVGSDTLASGWTELSFGTGDGGNVRTQTFTWDNHEIAVDNYEGYPGFAQGYPNDDLIPNATVPNLIGMTLQQADDALSTLAFSSAHDTTTVGATSANNGKVKSQSPAAGTLVNVSDVVTFTTYNYAGPTTGPVSGFNRTPTLAGWSLNGNQSVMYVVGQTVKPTVGDTISVTGSDNASHNVSWTVELVENENAYNTGGTAVKVTLVTGSIDSDTATGGTWTKI